MGGGHHQKKVAVMGGQVVQLGWIVHAGLVPSLLQLLFYMFCHIFSGAQGGTNQQMDHGHGAPNQVYGLFQCKAGAESKKGATMGSFFDSGKRGLDATLEFTGTGVDFDLVADLNEVSNRDGEIGAHQLGRLGDLAGGVATNGRLGVFDFTNHGDGQLDGDGLAVVESHFTDIFHAVNHVVQGVTEVFLLDVVLVVLGIHEDVHRIGKVRVGALFAFQLYDFQLVISLEHGFGTSAGEQVLQLHFDYGRITTGFVEFGFQPDP